MRTSQELDFRLITISKNNLSEIRLHILANALRLNPALFHYSLLIRYYQFDFPEPNDSTQWPRYGKVRFKLSTSHVPSQVQMSEKKNFPY